jgi:hypothetical protein
MALAQMLHQELIERRAYQRGYYDAAWSEPHIKLIDAIRTVKEEPLSPPFLRSSAAEAELIFVAMKKTMKLDIRQERRQEAREAAVKSSDPEKFLDSLMRLDSMPGGKRHTRRLRDFFACLFAQHLKHRAHLCVKIIRFCFHEAENVNMAALKQARAAFKRAFPNWCDVAKCLLEALRAPTVNARQNPYSV